MTAGTAVTRVVFAIEVEESRGTRQLADASAQLARELTAARAAVAHVSEGGSPRDAKGGSLAAVGELLVTTGLSAAGLKQLVRLAIAFVERGSARKITLESGGEKFVAEGLSAQTERQLADVWIARVLAAGHAATEQTVADEPKSGESA